MSSRAKAAAAAAAAAVAAGAVTVGGKPLCSNYSSKVMFEAVPRFARTQSESTRQAGQRVERDGLVRDLLELTWDLKLHGFHNVTVCFKSNFGPKQSQVIQAWRDFYHAQGAKTLVLPGLFSSSLANNCTINVVWAVKINLYFMMRKKEAFPHIMVLEEPWFWRLDPTGHNRIYSSIFWDYLNGYSLRWTPHPPDRWERIFAPHVSIAPWIPPRPDGSILLLGQIPTDTALMGARIRFGSIDAAYEYVVDSIRSQLPDVPIIYRPHPSINSSRIPCALKEIEGVIVQEASDVSLDKALESAALAVSISSTSLLQAVAKGVPVIALDSVSPVWPVACQSMDNLYAIVYGNACRPDRSQFFADIAYSLWSLDEIRNGDVFRYMFRTDMKLEPAGATPVNWIPASVLAAAAAAEAARS